MSNQLHDMLKAAFLQAVPVLGETFTYLGNTYTGIFSAANDRLLMDTVGYLDECDTLCVTSVDQFSVAPIVKTIMIRNGATYSVRSVTSDFSSYKLALKRISESVPSTSTGTTPGTGYGSAPLGSTSY